MSVVSASLTTRRRHGTTPFTGGACVRTGADRRRAQSPRGSTIRLATTRNFARNSLPRRPPSSGAAGLGLPAKRRVAHPRHSSPRPQPSLSGALLPLSIGKHDRSGHENAVGQLRSLLPVAVAIGKELQDTIG